MIKQGSSKTCANCTAYFGTCHCVPVSLNEQSANSCRFWGEKNMGRYFFSINSNLSFFLYGNFQKNLLELTVYFC